VVRREVTEFAWLHATNNSALGSDEIRSVEMRSDEVSLDL